MIELTQQDLYDILYGCTILWTRAGGSLEKLSGRIDEALAKGKRFRLASFDEVPDEAWIAIPYIAALSRPPPPSWKPSTPASRSSTSPCPTSPIKPSSSSWWPSSTE